MYTFCIVLIVIASILLVLAVLVQSPKSGMAANFGASNQVMGVRQTADFLEKATWGLAVVILVLSLVAVSVAPTKGVADANKNALVENVGDETEEAGMGVPSQDAAGETATENTTEQAKN